MPSIQFYEQKVQLLQSKKEIIDTLSGGDIIFWLDMCISLVNDLNEKILRPSLSRGDKQKFQTCVNHLTCIQAKFEQYSKRGGSLEEPKEVETRVQWRYVESAFQNRVKTGVVVNLKHVDILSFMKDAEVLFKVEMKKCLQEYNSVKVNSEFIAEFIIQKSGEEKTDIKYFATESSVIFQSTILGLWFEDNIKEPLLKDLEEFQERDSGWALKSIISLCINLKKYTPIKGSSYIDLPPQIKYKRACVNVKNNDDKCFMWSVLAALHAPIKKEVKEHSPGENDLINHAPEENTPEENTSKEIKMIRNPQRISHYKSFVEELSFAGIEFPMKIKDIRKFEVLNDISVNVYILKMHRKKFEVSPCFVTTEKRERHVNLLLIQDKYVDENGVDEQTELNSAPPKYHYVWITSLSRLVGSQASNNEHKTYHCERCLHFFYEERKLLAHENDCKSVNKCRINLPSEKDKILKFENHHHNEKVPIIIYADFECLLNPTGNEYAFQVHEAYSIGYYIKCSFDSTLSGYKSYRRQCTEMETPAKWFVRELKFIAAKLEEKYKNPVGMRLTDLEEIAFQRSPNCHICNKPFQNEETRVRDHCHLTGKCV